VRAVARSAVHGIARGVVIARLIQVYLESVVTAWLGEPPFGALPRGQIMIDPAHLYCGRCGSALPEPLRSAAPHGEGRQSDLEGDAGPQTPALCDACPACRGRATIADLIVRIGEHEGMLRRRVLALKHDPSDWCNAVVLADALGRALVTALHHQKAAEPAEMSVGDEGPLIVSVPMSWQRRMQRGVDHAALLARGAARASGGRVVTPLSRRHGPRQAGFRTVRQRIVRGGRGFRLRGDAAQWRSVFAGQIVVVVDDVLTTGTTVRRLVQRLRRFGPAKVVVAVATVRSWNRGRGVYGGKAKKC